MSIFSFSFTALGWPDTYDMRPGLVSDNFSAYRAMYTRFPTRYFPYEDDNR